MMKKSGSTPNSGRRAPTAAPAGRRTRGSTDDSAKGQTAVRTPTPTSTPSTRQNSSANSSTKRSDPKKSSNGSPVPVPIPIPSLARVTQRRNRSGSTAVPVSVVAPQTAAATVPVPVTPPPQTAAPRQQPASLDDVLSKNTKASSSSSASTLTKPLPPLVEPDTVPNVLVFGETGAGKSSVINMLAGSPVAGVSNAALGCTLGSRSYPVLLDGQQVRLWDTAGLSESNRGSIPAEVAIRNLRDLVGTLSSGVSLLVYCVRGTLRFRETWKDNYELFWGTICDGRVPIVVVVTGLEHQKPMEAWWDENVEQFEKNGMSFQGHACVTAIRGKEIKGGGGTMYDAEYEASRTTTSKLILDHLAKSPVRWIFDQEAWLSDVSVKLASYHDRSPAAGIMVINRRGRQDWQDYLWCLPFVATVLLLIVLGVQKVLA